MATRDFPSGENELLPVERKARRGKLEALSGPAHTWAFQESPELVNPAIWVALAIIGGISIATVIEIFRASSANPYAYGLAGICVVCSTAVLNAFFGRSLKMGSLSTSRQKV